MDYYQNTVFFLAIGGIAFPGKESASFSLFRLWESVGACIGYILSAYVCVYAKISILMSVLIVGLISYTIFFYLLSQKKTKALKGDLNKTKQQIETISIKTFDTHL